MLFSCRFLKTRRVYTSRIHASQVRKGKADTELLADWLIVGHKEGLPSSPRHPAPIRMRENSTAYSYIVNCCGVSFVCRANKRSL